MQIITKQWMIRNERKGALGGNVTNIPRRLWGTRSENRRSLNALKSLTLPADAYANTASFASNLMANRALDRIFFLTV